MFLPVPVFRQPAERVVGSDQLLSGLVTRSPVIMSKLTLLHLAARAASDATMCNGYGGRRYFSKEERKAWLEGYAEELENELKGVRERIQEISQASV